MKRKKSELQHELKVDPHEDQSNDHKQNIEVQTKERSHAGDVFPGVLKTEHRLSMIGERNRCRKKLPYATSSGAEDVPKSVAKAGMSWMRMDPLRKPGRVSCTTMGCISPLWLQLRCIRWPRSGNTCMEAWKANCATLDEKVTAVTKQLDEKVVAISRQLTEHEAIAAKQLQAREDCDLLRAAGAQPQARVGQLEGRLDMEIEQLNDELAGLEGAGSSMRSVESSCMKMIKGHQNRVDTEFVKLKECQHEGVRKLSQLTNMPRGAGDYVSAKWRGWSFQRFWWVLGLNGARRCEACAGDLRQLRACRT